MKTKQDHMLNQLYPGISECEITERMEYITLVLIGEHWFHVKVVHLRTGIRFAAEQECLLRSRRVVATWSLDRISDFTMRARPDRCTLDVLRTANRRMTAKNRMPAISYPYVTQARCAKVSDRHQRSQATGSVGAKRQFWGTCV